MAKRIIMDYISRWIESQLASWGQLFRVILLNGARQVGKSTLLGHLLPNAQRIVFEASLDPMGARSDPALFLRSHHPPVILDEVQYAPELLGHLKVVVDESQMRGQYWLTGSQNLLLARGVAESLSGRVAIKTLWGLALGEVLGRPASSILLRPILTLTGNELLAGLQVGSPPIRMVEALWRGSFPECVPLFPGRSSCLAD